MAKWGEGDPRWIVEERPDATNVNNWHWTEKNATPWSQEKIKKLFKNVEIPSDVATITIDEVDKLEGEASASNRKGKLIFFYEWNLILKWSGVLKNGTGVKYDGTITIPNISEENDVTDLDIQISVKEMDQDGQTLKDIMYKHGKDVVRDRVANYLAGLTQEFSQGMILPKKDGIKPDSVKILTSGFNKKIDMQPVVEEKKTVGFKLDTTTLKLNLKFQCKAMEFYDAMTRVEMVTAFTRGPVKLEVFKGGKFEMFGGNITGIFDELVKGKKIVQQWRYKQWPVGHYSTVTISIDEKDDHTQVNVVQSGVPTAEADTTRNNWNMYYWQSMKRTFGFGAFID